MKIRNIPFGYEIVGGRYVVNNREAEIISSIGILNERRLALKSQGCTLGNSEEYVGVFNLLSRFLDLLPA